MLIFHVSDYSILIPDLQMTVKFREYISVSTAIRFPGIYCNFPKPKKATSRCPRKFAICTT